MPLPEFLEIGYMSALMADRSDNDDDYEPRPIRLEDPYSPSNLIAAVIVAAVFIPLGWWLKGYSSEIGYFALSLGGALY